MARKKTREQKIRTASRKQLLGTVDLQKSIASRTLQYGYDPGLIRKDLGKTFLICGIILGIELAIYWWLW